MSAPDCHSRVETRSQLEKDNVCSALQFSNCVSKFLSVSDLCSFSTTCLSGFVRLRAVLLLKRHLSLAGTDLVEVPIAQLVALTFDLSSGESNYIRLRCSSSFIMLSPAIKCSCHFSDLPKLATSLPSSVSVSDCEDNVTIVSCISKFNSNRPLGLPCDPVCIPVPCDDDELDDIKPDETIKVKTSNETFETAYPPIFYELAPRTCALTLLSPVEVCTIASTCVASHDRWQETACLRRHLELTRGQLGDYFFSSRVQLSFFPNQQSSVYLCLSCNSQFKYLTNAFKCACQRSPSGNDDSLGSNL